MVGLLLHVPRGCTVGGMHRIWIACILGCVTGSLQDDGDIGRVEELDGVSPLVPAVLVVLDLFYWCKTGKLARNPWKY